MNRLNKTKVERTVDLRAEREQRDREEREDQKKLLQEQRRKEKEEDDRKKKDAELRLEYNLIYKNPSIIQVL